MTRLFENPHFTSGEIYATTIDHNLGAGSVDTVAQDQFLGTRTLIELSSKRTVFSVISPVSSSVPGRLQLERMTRKNAKIKEKSVRIIKAKQRYELTDSEGQIGRLMPNIR